MAKIILIFVFSLSFFFNLVYSENNPPRFELPADQRAILVQKLDQQWSRMFIPALKNGTSLIDVAMFALNAVSVDYRTDRIDIALKDLKDNINLSNQNPKTYGNIFWYCGDTQINDPNAVEFCMRVILPIWILYQDKLSPNTKALLQTIFDQCSEGIKRHYVRLSYTNIILMKTANLIMMGEYDNRPEMAKAGYDLLQEWIKYTYRNGLCEYLSPTYYTVDIENLSLIVHFSQSPEIQKIASTALEYLWTDIAVNWYGPSGRLGGTHSRDYDRLYGHNSIDQMMTRAGWNSLEGGSAPFKSVFDYYSFIKPDPELKKYLTAPLPRFIYERWGEEPYQRASNYLGHNFSVASAEANYHDMDKTPFVINSGSGSDIPVINFFMDGRGDYYGLKKILEKSGHLKSLHLMPFLTSVQNNSEVLFLASIKGNTNKTTEKLESVITLPSDAFLWLDDKKLKIFNSRSSWQTNPDANNGTTWLNIISINHKPTVQLIDNDKNEGIGFRQKLAVTPHEYYKLRAHMMGGSICLYINFYDQNNNLIEKEHAKSFPLSKNEFTWNEITEKAPEGAKYCYAWIYSTKKNVSQVFINDLSFEEIADSNLARNLGHFDFEEFIPQKLKIPENATLFIQREDVVTAIRLLKAVDVAGKAIPFELFNDGLQYGALRLTATHSQSKTGQRGTIVVWSYTEEGIISDQKLKAFRQKVMAIQSELQNKQNILDVKVSGINGSLEIKADLENEKTIYRSGMKAGLEDSLLSVNGNDVGRTILESLDIIQKAQE